METRPSSPWLSTLSRLAGIIAGAAAVGLAMGRAWEAVAIAAIAFIGWQYWMLHRLMRRVAGRRRLDATDGPGAWKALDAQLQRAQSDTLARKRRLVDMLRAYRAVAAALPDAVVVVDRNHQRVQWFNEAATRLLGLRHPHDTGAALVQRLRPLPLAHWLSAGRHAEPLLDIASPVDANLRLSLRLIPYSAELWLLVARDVTKLMHLEQMRRDFVANVSHELRTPLTVIHGYLEMLDPEEQPSWRPMLAEMQHQSQRMTQLVEDLLALSRLEARDTLPDDVVPMAAMLATLKREGEALGQQRHEISLEDEAGVDLLGSGRELHSAFSNLVANAVRYTPSGGRIKVRMSRCEDGGVSLAVHDTGYGIPHAHLPRITERFYRVSSSRSRESGGTGLGLAIVKHVLQLHQAKLAIDSEIGRGSVFACHFGPGRVHPRAPQHTGGPRGQQENRTAG